MTRCSGNPRGVAPTGGKAPVAQTFEAAPNPLRLFGPIWFGPIILFELFLWISFLQFIDFESLLEYRTGNSFDSFVECFDSALKSAC